jgi:S-adenosylhomocysteine hydrolase
VTVLTPAQEIVEGVWEERGDHHGVIRLEGMAKEGVLRYPIMPSMTRSQAPVR